MQKKTPDIRFIVLFGFVWIAFGVFGLIFAPERILVAISQLVAGVVHFGYALWLRYIAKSKST